MHASCRMGRKPCCEREGVNRGTWSAVEDKILTNYIKVHGEGKWRDLPKRAGLNRCGKSCRLRWLNYLRPDIKRGNISGDEEELIIRLHKLLGNRWSLIAGRLPGRTDNEIKNYWNTNLSKRVKVEQINKKPHESAGNVIRTKAVRCSKVMLPMHMQDWDRHRQNPCSNSFIPQLQHHNDIDTSANFLIDFDISDLLVPEATEMMPNTYAFEHHDSLLAEARPPNSNCSSQHFFQPPTLLLDPPSSSFQNMTQNEAHLL